MSDDKTENYSNIETDKSCRIAALQTLVNAKMQRVNLLPMIFVFIKTPLF